MKEIYKVRGFSIVAVHGDNEFDIETVKNLAVTSYGTHLRENEYMVVVGRSIRTVKGKCRTMTHIAPYRRVPKLIVIALVESSIL